MQAKASKIGGGALSWAFTRIILSSAGEWNARGYPACWIRYWRRQRCWRTGRRGGSLLSLFTAGAGCRGRTATSNKDDQQRFMAEPLLASTKWEHVSNLRCSRDATFQRRVDGLLAKNCARGDGMGGGGVGGTTTMAACRLETMREDSLTAKAKTKSVGNGKSRGGGAQLGGSLDGDQCSRCPRWAIPAT